MTAAVESRSPGAVQKASNSQWVPQTGLQFPSKSSLCWRHKQIGNLRNNKKLAICLEQSAQTVKDSLPNRAYCSSQPRSATAGPAVALALTPLAAWQDGCFSDCLMMAGVAALFESLGGAPLWLIPLPGNPPQKSRTPCKAHVLRKSNPGPLRA